MRAFQVEGHITEEVMLSDLTRKQSDLRQKREQEHYSSIVRSAH